MTHEPDIKGLEEFYTEGDKNSPQFFAGRQELISAIETTVDKLRNDVKRLPISEVHPKQQTWLVQGAPGAGKTALQWYLRDRWLADKDGPVVVNALLGDLADRDKLTASIANKILPKGEDQLRTERTVSHTAGVQAKLAASRTTSESIPRGALDLADLRRLYQKPRMHWFRRLLPFGRRKVAEPRPVVLIIDEIQAMNSETDEVLHDLHVGVAGLPVIPLLAGLAWSRERLREAGISRFNTGQMSHVQTLTPLQPEEAAESVKLMLRAYYVTATDKEAEDIACWIAGLSDGWPQHLRHYMRALAGNLAANKGNLSALDRNWVQAEGDAKRQSYYLDRLQSLHIGTHTRLLVQVASTIGNEGCHYDKLVRLLRDKLWQRDLEHSEVMPEGMKPQEFIEELVQAGLIHRVVDEITIPIPSFRKFIMDRPYTAARIQNTAPAKPVS